jgi:hypothetical protein
MTIHGPRGINEVGGQKPQGGKPVSKGCSPHQLTKAEGVTNDFGITIKFEKIPARFLNGSSGDKNKNIKMYVLKKVISAVIGKCQSSQDSDEYVQEKIVKLENVLAQLDNELKSGFCDSKEQMISILRLTGDQGDFFGGSVKALVKAAAEQVSSELIVSGLTGGGGVVPLALGVVASLGVSLAIPPVGVILGGIVVGMAMGKVAKMVVK